MVSSVPFLGIHADSFVLRKNDFVASILRPETIVAWLKKTEGRSGKKTGAVVCRVPKFACPCVLDQKMSEDNHKFGSCYPPDYQIFWKNILK